jgi:hypothetical protein
LHRWVSDPRFRLPSGGPCPLPFDGASPSFSELVAACAADAAADTVRIELRRVGALGERPDGLLELRRRHFVPEAPDARLIEGINFGLRTVAATVAFNAGTQPGGHKRFQRLVQNRFVPVVRCAEVEEAIRLRLTEVSEELDDYFAEVGSPAATPGTCNVGVGLYYFEEAEPRGQNAHSPSSAAGAPP